MVMVSELGGSNRYVALALTQTLQIVGSKHQLLSSINVIILGWVKLSKIRPFQKFELNIPEFFLCFQKITKLDWPLEHHITLSLSLSLSLYIKFTVFFVHFACRATLEVTVKPQSGMSSPRERLLEELLTSCCKSTILVHLHPHTAISLTLQVENDDGMVCYQTLYCSYIKCFNPTSCYLHWSTVVVWPCWMLAFLSPMYSQHSHAVTLKMVY